MRRLPGSPGWSRVPVTEVLGSAVTRVVCATDPDSSVMDWVGGTAPKIAGPVRVCEYVQSFGCPFGSESRMRLEPEPVLLPPRALRQLERDVLISERASGSRQSVSATGLG